jgi:hypothetical protein
VQEIGDILADDMDNELQIQDDDMLILDILIDEVVQMFHLQNMLVE